MLNWFKLFSILLNPLFDDFDLVEKRKVELKTPASSFRLLVLRSELFKANLFVHVRVAGLEEKGLDVCAGLLLF